MWDQETKISAEDQQALKQALEAMKGGDLALLGKLLQRPGMSSVLAQLFKPLANELVSRLDDMARRRHMRELYDAIARPLARTVKCDEDDMAVWLAQHAEPNTALSVPQRQASQRAASKLGDRLITMEVRYSKGEGHDRYLETTLAWLIDADGVHEHIVERSIPQDLIPEQAREALIKGERIVTFKPIE